MARMGENAQILIGISASAKEGPTTRILKINFLKSAIWGQKSRLFKTRLRIDIL